VLHFDDSAEAGAADEFTDACGDDDGLALADAAEAAEVEVVEVGVADEDGVDGWEVVDFEAWVADAFDEAEPVGPDGVDEDVEALGLKEEGGVADPCDLEVWAVVAEEVGAVRGSAAEGEELGEEDAASEVVVAAGPALRGEEADARAAEAARARARIVRATWSRSAGGGSGSPGAALAALLTSVSAVCQGPEDMLSWEDYATAARRSPGSFFDLIYYQRQLRKVRQGARSSLGFMTLRSQAPSAPYPSATPRRAKGPEGVGAVACTICACSSHVL
jgi:hypothetical protein